MCVDRNDTIRNTSEETANGLLADSLARVKRGVLTHVAEIGRDENKSLGTIASHCFDGKQESKKFFIWPIERRVDDRHRRKRRNGHAQFPVREPVYRVSAAAMPSRDASRLASLAPDGRL